MGSIVMEPDDIAAYVGGGDAGSFKNLTTICTPAYRIHSAGVFVGENPLEYSVPLLFLQFSICAGTIVVFSKLLKPLGQLLIVSQIMGGLVLGSSVLGQFESFKRAIFPLRGFILLDIVSSLGFIFYFFLIGVQMDISIIKRINKRTFAVGCCSVACPLVLTTISSLGLTDCVDPHITKSFPMVAEVQSIINFPMVACFLAELNLINSDFGRVALSSSMAASFCSFCIMTLGILLNQHENQNYEVLSLISTAVVVAAIIIFAIRPAVLWMVKKNPAGQPLKEGYVITLLLGVLVTAFCSQATGLHITFGPLVLGITIPPGPPIGSALVERLDFITSWVFMPIFFAKIGLIINIFTIKLNNFLVLSFIGFMGAVGKFLGAFLIAMYCKVSVRNAVSLGLILNSRGALELGLFKMMKKENTIDHETFEVMCIFMLILIAVITPIIRWLYDPSKKYAVYRRRTVMHSKPESDLRLLVCIHDQEDVPNAINLLEALNPTRQSHLVVYVLHLVELLGRANPQLIPHKVSFERASRSCPSEHIAKAFNYFGESNQDIVTVFPFTAISPAASMHDDVCTLALDKKTSLLLVPFHRRFHSNGVMLSCKSKMRMVNNHILDKAPCSVALIVDRGLLKVSRPIRSNSCPFHMAILFLGGPDDREAMFVGARMAGHPSIHLTMIRLLENEDATGDNTEERMLDTEAVCEFRQSMASNHRVTYNEEVVKDGTGTISVLRSMGNNLQLVMVGRRHLMTSPLVQGLVLWNEHTELGAIGEVLASSEFMGNALILVVQQHTHVVDEGQENHQEDTVIPMERYLAADVEDDDNNNNDDDATEDMPIHGQSLKL